MRKVYPVAVDRLHYTPVFLPPQIWREPFVSSTGVLQAGSLGDFQSYIRSLFNLLVARSGGLIELDQLAVWLPLGFTNYINAAGNPRTRLGTADAVFLGGPGRTFYGVERVKADGAPTIPAQVTLAHEIAHNLGGAPSKHDGRMRSQRRRHGLDSEKNERDDPAARLRPPHLYIQGRHASQGHDELLPSATLDF